MYQSVPSVNAEPTFILSILMNISVAVIIAAIVFLIFKFVFKLTWFASISITVLYLIPTIILGVTTNIPSIAIVFWSIPVICVLVYIAWFFQWVFSASTAKSSVNPQERSRILKLVEDGKINTEEGKELLDAMGKSSALRGEEKFSRVDLAILAGVGLVVLGFFLPWNYVRLPKMPGLGIMGSSSAYQAGYNAAAIGWTIFIIALASAIPVFVTPRNLLYKISMLQIFLAVIGVILVISVLVQVGEHLGVGLIICLAGFLTAFFASLAKFKSLAA